MKKNTNILLLILVFASVLVKAQEPRLMLPMGHAIEIDEVGFSPNGKFILTTSSDATCKVWSMESGELLLNFQHSLPEEELYDAVYSLDGKRILTLTDQRVIVWDAYTGKKLKEKQGDFSESDIFFISPDKAVIGKEVWDITLNKLYENAALASKPKPTEPQEVDSLTDEKVEKWYSENGMAAEIENEDATYFAYYSPDRSKIISVTGDNGAIWDAKTGFLIGRLKAHSAKVWSLVYSIDGKRIVTASADNIARVWDAECGKLLFSIKAFSEFIMMWSAALSPDGRYLICASELDQSENEDLVKVWDFEKNQFIIVTEGHSNFVTSGSFSGDSKHVIIPTDGDSVFLWNLDTRKPVKKFMLSSPHLATFSNDGKKILLAGGTVRVIDAVTYKRLSYFTIETDVISYRFSSDGKRIVVLVPEDGSSIWDAETGKEIETAGPLSDKLGDMFTFNAHYSPDGKKIAFSAGKVFDEKTGKLLFTLGDTPDHIFSVMFSPDGKKIATSSLSNTCDIWDANTGKLIYSFFGIDSTEHMIMLPTGEYMGSQGAPRHLHYVTKDLDIITFQQLDAKYNRPDKVMKQLGCADDLLTGSYHKAWLKRIKKMQIDTSTFRKGFTPPKTEIVNRNKVSFRQVGEKLTLQIKANDPALNLERFNVWINESPVYGMSGINLKRKRSRLFDTTITIILSKGANRVETSVTNINGTESYRLPLRVHYDPATPQKETTWFIGIGIDRFQDSSKNLLYSVKDITDFAAELKKKFGDNINSTILTNENVSIEKVKALKEGLRKTSVNDKVIIAYSGHGLLSDSLDYFLSTYAVNFKKPSLSGLPYEVLESLLDNIPARKKLLLIDACHSGEVDKDEILVMDNKAASLNLKKGRKGGYTESTGEAHLGLNNSFELMQNLFVNVGKSTGAVIISAAAGNQYALEGVDNLPNGVFTYCLLEAMKENKTMKVSELKKKIGLRVEEITKGLQKPTSRSETLLVDWDVW